MRAREWGMQKGKEGDALLLEDEIPKEKEEIQTSKLNKPLKSGFKKE